MKLVLPRSEIRRYGDLLYVMVERNLKTRYRGSLLGVYWSLLNPLIMTGLYTAIFGVAFSDKFSGSLVDYALAAFTGLVLFHFFSSATVQALTSVVENGELLNKVRLPFTMFPIVAVAANVFQFAIGSLPLLLIVCLWKSQSLLNVAALLLPFGALVAASLGFGFLVSGLYIFFRDMAYLYDLVSFTLWVSAAIFYPIEIVPPVVRPLLYLNPLTSVIESARQIVLSGGTPEPAAIGRSLLVGLLFFTVGWSCFRWWRPQFMDLL